MKFSLRITMVSAFLASAPAFGEAMKFPETNDRLESTGNLALRATSPDPAFGNKGEQIGWIKEGQHVVVLSAKQISTVYGFELWVEVASAGDTSQKGWIYDGLSSEVLKGKAKLVAPKPTLVVARRM